jgi:RNA polymerase sigma-70 factor (ECF subfamily)
VIFREECARRGADPSVIAFHTFAAMTPALATSPSVALRAPLAGAAIPWSELVAQRAYLVRFARRRLHDAALAEDAVHDVFEAVLSGRASFGGRAALRSWLTAVLKHKIVDLLRRHRMHEPLDGDDGQSEAAAIASLEPGPDEIAEQRERLERTLARIETLPPNLREAMRLRVLEDQPSDAVCATLGITEDNLFVRMHRARRHLAS